MAHKGKIAFHLPGTPGTNYDTSDIKFLPAGQQSVSTISDLTQIDKVYAIPAGVTITSVSQLQNYVVWEKIEGYVKYIMYLEDSSENNFVFQDLYINGEEAGQALTNVTYCQREEWGWNVLSSSEIQSLQNGNGSAWYGSKSKITFVTSSPTSFGFRTKSSNQGHTHYTVKIYGVDSNNNEILLKTEELNNIGLLDTRTINI